MKFLLLLLSFCIFGMASPKPTTTPPLIGGAVDRDPSEYTDQMWMAFEKINEGIENGPYWAPVKVLTAKTQVVAGSLTILQVLVGQSLCTDELVLATTTTENGGSNSPWKSMCHVEEGAKRAVYMVEIWEKPWKKFIRISAVKVRDVEDGEEL